MDLSAYFRIIDTNPIGIKMNRSALMVATMLAGMPLAGCSQARPEMASSAVQLASETSASDYMNKPMGLLTACLESLERASIKNGVAPAGHRDLVRALCVAEKQAVRAATLDYFARKGDGDTASSLRRGDETVHKIETAMVDRYRDFYRKFNAD